MLALVLVDAAVWATWSTLVGGAASRLPAELLSEDSWLTRPRRFEQGGRLYERVGIRRWKDAVPDAGAWFGGLTKRRLPSRDRDGLRRFAAETRRAEYVHWAILGVTPVFLVWNPPLLAAAMVVYGVTANVPCLAIQRYTRARLVRMEARR